MGLGCRINMVTPPPFPFSLTPTPYTLLGFSTALKIWLTIPKYMFAVMCYEKK